MAAQNKLFQRLIWLAADEEINNPHRMMLKDLFPHFELINARFDLERAE